MPKNRTLYCKLGQHEWERPVQRGKIPLNCPIHKPVKEPKPKVIREVVEGPSKSRIQDIKTILENRPPECFCEVSLIATDDELMLMQGCQDKWVCSTLDKIRRRVVDYGRYLRTDTFEE